MRSRVCLREMHVFTNGERVSYMSVRDVCIDGVVGVWAVPCMAAPHMHDVRSFLPQTKMEGLFVLPYSLYALHTT